MENQGVTFKIPNLRSIVNLVRGLLITVFVLAALILVYQTLDRNNTDISIIPQQPLGQASPYICFAALQGDHRILALDCIDASLTDISAGPFETTLRQIQELSQSSGN